MTDERINERTFVNVELLSRLKIVAAMTKVARVPFSMQKRVFFKNFCRGPLGHLKTFYHKKCYIPMSYTQFL